MSELNPDRDHNNPTSKLRLPAPLTAAQLDALRPKPDQTVETAQRFAYRTASHIDIALRLESLERTVSWLKEELVRQAAPKI